MVCSDCGSMYAFYVLFDMYNDGVFIVVECSLSGCYMICNRLECVSTVVIFCLICDAWRFKCLSSGSFLVSLQKYWMLVSNVQPVEMRSAVFCKVCSFVMFCNVFRALRRSFWVKFEMFNLVQPWISCRFGSIMCFWYKYVY